jgi:hypothetical protein
MTRPRHVTGAAFHASGHGGAGSPHGSTRFWFRLGGAACPRRSLLLLLPHCDSDGARARSNRELARADVVPMHRMQRVRPKWRFCWSSIARASVSAIYALAPVAIGQLMQGNQCSQHCPRRPKAATDGVEARPVHAAVVYPAVGPRVAGIGAGCELGVRDDLARWATSEEPPPDPPCHRVGRRRRRSARAPSPVTISRAPSVARWPSADPRPDPTFHRGRATRRYARRRCPSRRSASIAPLSHRAIRCGHRRQRR